MLNTKVFVVVTTKFLIDKVFRHFHMSEQLLLLCLVSEFMKYYFTIFSKLFLFNVI